MAFAVPFLGMVGAALVAHAGAIMSWIGFGMTVFSLVDGLTGKRKSALSNTMEGGYGSPTYSFGALQTQVSNLMPRPIVYGKVKMAGNKIWQSGINTSTIKQLVLFADGEIYGYEDIRFNDKLVGELNGCSVTRYYGDGTQTIDSRVTGSTNEERAQLVGGLTYDAYLAITAQSSESIPDAGFNVTAIVSGRIIEHYTDIERPEYAQDSAYDISNPNVQIFYDCQGDISLLSSDRIKFLVFGRNPNFIHDPENPAYTQGTSIIICTQIDKYKALIQYNLSEPYDLSTATLYTEYIIYNSKLRWDGIWLPAYSTSSNILNDLRLYVFDAGLYMSQGRCYQIPYFDLKSPLFTELYTFPQGFQAPRIQYISPNGRYIYEYYTDLIYELSTPHNLNSTWTPIDTYLHPVHNSIPYHYILGISPDGTEAYYHSYNQYGSLGVLRVVTDTPYIFTESTAIKFPDSKYYEEITPELRNNNLWSWTVSSSGTDAYFKRIDFIAFDSIKDRMTCISGVDWESYGMKIFKVGYSNDIVVDYNNNPVWCIKDFLTNYNGMGISDDDLYLPSFFTEAEYCDELVDDQPRFTLNLVLDSRKSRLDWLNTMLLVCRGYLVFIDEKIHIKIDKAGTSEQSFSGTNIVAGSEKFWTTPRESKYDVVKVQFVDPDNEWARVYAIAELPIYNNEQPIVKEVEAFGVTNFKQASRLAWFYLNEASTTNKFYSFITTTEGLDRTVGDLVDVTSPTFGWTNKVFRIINLSEEEDGKIKITCKEYNANLYTDTQGSVAPTYTVYTPEDSIDFGTVSTGGGSFVQTTQSSIVSTSGLSITEVIPADSSLPQNTEGTEIWSALYTPNNQDAQIRISATVPSIYVDTATTVILALFKDDDCVGVTSLNLSNIGSSASYSMQLIQTIQTSGVSTFQLSLRIGVASSGPTLMVGGNFGDAGIPYVEIVETKYIESPYYLFTEDLTGRILLETDSLLKKE